MEQNISSEFLAWFLEAINILQHQIFSRDNMVQIPAVMITFVLAWLLAHVSGPLLRSFFHHLAVDREQEDFYVSALLPLFLPASWIVALWLSMLAADHFGWPSHLVNIVLDLAAAWLVVRFASALIPNALASRVVAIIAWTVAALSILGLLPPLIDALGAASFSLGATRTSLLVLLEAAISAVILIWGSVAIARIVEQRMSTMTSLSPSFRVLFGKLFKFCLISFAVMLSLGAFGIDLTAFAVFTGALGVGLGFGLQKSVANLFAGVILLIDKSIKPGDIIEVGGTFGWVTAVRARYVEVETRDGTEFLIPNEDIVTQKVFNWTHQDDNVRLKLPVRVAFDADVRKAILLMTEAAGRTPRVLEDPPPSPRVIGFGENGVELELRFWIADVRNGVHNVMSEVLIELLDLFQEHGVRVPLPQRDLYIHKFPEGFTPSQAFPRGL